MANCRVRVEPGDLPELAAFRCRASLNFELYRFPILKGGNPERRHNSRQTIRMYDTYLDVPVYSGCRVCTFPNAAFCRFDPCWCANPHVCLFSRRWAGNGFVPLKSRRALLPTHVLWTCTPKVPILCVWMESGNAVALFRLCESTNANTAVLTEPPKSSTRKLCATQTCFTACLLSARTFSTPTTRAKSSALENFQYEFRSSKHRVCCSVLAFICPGFHF